MLVGAFALLVGPILCLAAPSWRFKHRAQFLLLRCALRNIFSSPRVEISPDDERPGRRSLRRRPVSRFRGAVERGKRTRALLSLTVRLPDIGAQGTHSCSAPSTNTPPSASRTRAASPSTSRCRSAMRSNLKAEALLFSGWLGASMASLRLGPLPRSASCSRTTPPSRRKRPTGGRSRSSSRSASAPGWSLIRSSSPMLSPLLRYTLIRWVRSGWVRRWTSSSRSSRSPSPSRPRSFAGPSPPRPKPFGAPTPRCSPSPSRASY